MTPPPKTKSKVGPPPPITVLAIFVSTESRPLARMAVYLVQKRIYTTLLAYIEELNSATHTTGITPLARVGSEPPPQSEPLKVNSSPCRSRGAR